MDVLIVGSIAYDSIESPEGKVEGTLGGSATYAGIACQFHADRLDCDTVGLVGVVGLYLANSRHCSFLLDCSGQ